MSDTIRNVNITDDIIGTESEVMFGVLSGAQNITSQTFKSISATPNAMVFNIVLPSLETIMARNLMLTTRMTLEINYRDSKGGTGTKPAGHALVSYGTTDSLSNFPLNQLINLNHSMQYQQ